jgi:hypothetical protein
MEGSGHGVFKVIFQHLPGEAEVTTKFLSQNNWSPGLDLSSGLTEHETQLIFMYSWLSAHYRNRIG